MPLLEIEIDKLAADKSKKTKTRKTPGYFSKKEDQPLSRRHKSGGYINFYDLGQIRDGVNWVDIDFEVLSGAVTTGVGGSAVFNRPTLLDWEALWNKIFEVPIADWKTRYRKLEYEDAERYGLDILDPTVLYILNEFYVGRTNSRYSSNDGQVLITGDKWFEEGLKLEAEDYSDGPTLFTVRDAGAFHGMEGSSAVKVTSVYDITAPNVPFTFLGPADVFLMPRLVAHAATDGLVGSDRYILIGPYKAYSREFWLNRVDPNLDYPLLTHQDPNTEWVFNSTNSLDLVAHLEASPLSRTFHYDPGPDILTEIASAPPGTYTTAYFELDSPAGTGIPVLLNFAEPAPMGTLTGVIKKGSSTYYFWQIDHRVINGIPPRRRITLT